MKACICFLSAAMTLLVVVLLMVGCVSNEPGSTNGRPGSGIAEYRKVATDAQKALGRALSSLTAVSGQSNQCSPEVLSAFSSEFQRLQVESVQIRARSQAMQARGDAYFDSWQEQMERIKDPQLRARIESQRPAFQGHFQKIKALSQEGHAAFGPFLAGMRKVRNSLEKDPASLGTQTVQVSIASTRAQGEKVDRYLTDIRHEFDSMMAMLTAPRSAAKTSNSG
jgi:hypothetical protein